MFLFYIFLSFSLFTSVLFLYLGYLFYTEREMDAMRKSFLISFIILLLSLTIFHFQISDIIYLIIALLVLFIMLLLYPFKTDPNFTDDIPNGKFDERDIMFSRRELIPGGEKYKAYYEKHPEREVLDNAFRSEPGLLSPKATYFHEKAFRQANESFSKIVPLYRYIDGKVNRVKTRLSAEEFTNLIKSRAKELGVLDVGITETKPYHYYSHKGRGKEYGNRIENHHRYAIAFTVEMNLEMVMAAPQASIVAESAKQYLNSGRIATQIAELIRNLGYEARPHIDGNYQLICPLVARDAGLGELGRMGLLMTKHHGPRARIAVVTTNLDLIPDKYQKDHSAIDFCRMCKKCADCCPSQSISHEDPKLHDGVKRWKIDSESCFTFWCKAGTDCGRCMAVCPYAHSNHSFHKIIRWGNRHSKFARYLAVRLDDFFYGKKPVSKPLPEDFEV